MKLIKKGICRVFTGKNIALSVKNEKIITVITIGQMTKADT